MNIFVDSFVILFLWILLFQVVFLLMNLIEFLLESFTPLNYNVLKNLKYIQREIYWTLLYEEFSKFYSKL